MIKLRKMKKVKPRYGLKKTNLSSAGTSLILLHKFVYGGYLPPLLVSMLFICLIQQMVNWWLMPEHSNLWNSIWYFSLKGDTFSCSWNHYSWWASLSEEGGGCGAGIVKILTENTNENWYVDIFKQLKLNLLITRKY